MEARLIVETIVPAESSGSENEFFREEPPQFEPAAPPDQDQVFSSAVILLENARGPRDLKSAVRIFRSAASATWCDAV